MQCLRASLLLLTILSFCSCSSSKNYEQAVAQTHGGKTVIKLKGKRLLMAHDPISALTGKTYEDSLLIPVANLADGTIRGQDIPVTPGNYGYNGTLVIRGNRLVVNLCYDNTDDKRNDALSWNGQYSLRRD